MVDFAHSPASLERALETLRPLVAKDSGRLIAIFGCAGLRDRGKRRLMGQVGGRLADFTVITAEDPRTEDLVEINREIEAGVLEVVESGAGEEGEPAGSSPFYAIVPDRAEAIRFGGGDGACRRRRGLLWQGSRTQYVLRRDGVSLERAGGDAHCPVRSDRKVRRE